MIVKNWYNNILKIDFVYKTNIVNTFRFPKIKKVFINLYSKEIIENAEKILFTLVAIKLIVGKLPIILKSKKSVSVLKLRKGMITGFKIILKNLYIYNFLYFFLTCFIPNIKDLNSDSYKIDSKGYSTSIGIKNLLFFPQISYLYKKFPKNMNVAMNLVIKDTNLISSKILLSGIQIPFFKYYKVHKLFYSYILIFTDSYFV